MVAASAALHELITTVGGTGRFELEHLTSAHRALMADDPEEADYAGRLRDMQNWIGGSDHSPRSALHVLPAPGRVPDYVYWQTQDRKALKRINMLIADVLRDPFEGVGKPEPLRHVLSGAWSRRIDEKNRLVYYVTDEHIVILQARDHY